MPLLAAIDRAMARKPRILVAIEGGSASGKTTLAALLGRIYDCQTFHMDDFFLRPEQRTAAFGWQSLAAMWTGSAFSMRCCFLSQGRPVSYRRYDCHTQLLGDAAVCPPKPLNLIEGAYSMHPLLADHYDLSVFLSIPPDLQPAYSPAQWSELAEQFFPPGCPWSKFISTRWRYQSIAAWFWTQGL